MQTEATAITLSELSNKIQGAISQYFGQETYWIIAEISGHKFYPNNDRHYFDFVEKVEGEQEPRARIRGISWFQGSQSIKNFEQHTSQQFTNGLQVLCRVKVEYHSAHGLSLIVQEVDINYTLGNLEKQRRLTLERLVRENPDAIVLSGDEYITTNKKAIFPPVIQDIAVIGSPNSEGHTDFVHTIKQNQFHYAFRLHDYQTSVQGSGAESEIITTLIEIHQSGKKYDCIVIIRGGGAKTDFLVFDSYRLARAVARFPIPIITGIGHHKDVSIVDMMTHTSTKTPTKAAEFIIAHNRNFEEQITDLQKKIVIRTQQRLAENLQELQDIKTDITTNTRNTITIYKDELHYFRNGIVNQSRSLIFRNKNELTSAFSQMHSRPLLHTKGRMAEIETVMASIKSNSLKMLQLNSGYLNHHISVVKMMQPENLLKKGFALIQQNNKIVSGIKQISADAPLTIMMQDGTIETTIKKIQPANEK